MDPYIISFDYEKAFDSVTWPSIRKALEFFGFGPYFRDVIEMILCEPETCTLNAGYTSSYFKPRNGVRQGCCASPLLFIITAELLALMVRNNNNIRGIYIGNTEQKISQFADDAICFVDSRSSAEETVCTFATFTRFSGLKINMNKSKVLSLSKQGPSTSKVAGLEVVPKTSILGVWFARCRSLEEHYLWNFSTQLQKMRNTCKSWSNRTLSLKGKVTVFNTLVISLFQYTTANTVTPGRVVQEVKDLARTFVWSSKQSKVAYDTIIQSIKDGGLRLADLETRIKASLLAWVRRILLNTECSAAETLRTCTNENNLTLILGTKRHFHQNIKKRSSFYGEMLRIWKNSTTLPQEMRRKSEENLFGLTVASRHPETHLLD